MLLASCGQATSGPASPHPSPSTHASASPEPIPASHPPPPNLPPAAEINVPAGFRAYVYASGVAAVTAMAFGPDGRLYLTTAGGSLDMIPGPGQGPSQIAGGLPTALGLAWRGNDLFVSVRGGVRAFHRAGQGLSGGETVVSGLPAGRHQNDNILLLPNGDFLLGVGSTCDVCVEGDPRSASVLRFHGDWSYAGVVVRGARNPYGLAWRWSDRRAYVTINGQDNLGSQPADHMIAVQDGADAGWPRCWPAYPDGGLHGSCAGVTPPLAVFTPHTSADGVLFYEGTEFPSEYQDNAFVAEWGANAGGGTGRRVVRAALGSRVAVATDFATGFSHPLALAVATDGGLLVGDYGSGRIVEIFSLG